MKQDPFSDPAKQHAEVPIVIPGLGTGEKPMTFIMWLVDQSANVISGERIAEILVDSTVVHLDAPVNGTLIQMETKPQERVQVGDVIGAIREE